MRHLAILSNPHSGGARRRLERISAIARQAGASHVVTQQLDEVEPALRSFAARGIDVLAIDGGDGTLQAALSTIRNKAIFHREPSIALLRSGTTNLVHRNVGLRGAPHRALERLAAACRNGAAPERVVPCPVIVVRHSDTNDAAFGFFFGAAALPRAILATRQQLHSRGLTGPAGEGLAFAWMLWRLLTGRVAEDPVLRPDTLAYALDDRQWREDLVVFFIATTLERLILGLRPAAARRQLGVIALRFPYRGLWRAVPALVTGHISAAADGLTRSDAREITLRAEATYLLDGEMFPATRAAPVHLAVAPAAQFVRL